MATKVETTATATITTTETYVETMHTAAFTTVNTDGAPVTRYAIGTTYTYGTHTYSIVGVRKYNNDKHSYWLVRFDADKNTYELTADKIKDYVGDDRKQPRNGSVNDDKKATGTKRVPKTANETAAQIKTKYADTIKAVREKVSKLQDDDRITSALNLLCTMIETARDQRVEEITNAALIAHNKRMQEIENIEFDLPLLQEQINEAMKEMDFAKVATLGKQAQELQAHLLLLQQQEAAYNATLATAQEDTDTDTDTQSADTTQEDTTAQE